MSDPTSREYGQYLTNEEVNELVAPSDQDVSQVLQWVSSHGISTHKEHIVTTPNKDMIRVKCTVAQAEALLHTQYHEYAHKTNTKVQIVRALSYKLPSYLAEKIDSVGPVTRFPSLSTVRAAKPLRKPKTILGARSAPKKPAYDCSQGTTPDCLKGLYNVSRTAHNASA